MSRGDHGFQLPVPPATAANPGAASPPPGLAPAALRIAVVGGGPAGLYVAIGAAMMGHTVVVIERMEHPRVRGTSARRLPTPQAAASV